MKDADRIELEKLIAAQRRYVAAMKEFTEATGVELCGRPEHIHIFQNMPFVDSIGETMLSRNNATVEVSASYDDMTIMTLIG